MPAAAVFPVGSASWVGFESRQISTAVHSAQVPSRRVFAATGGRGPRQGVKAVRRSAPSRRGQSATGGGRCVHDRAPRGRTARTARSHPAVVPRPTPVTTSGPAR